MHYLISILFRKDANRVEAASGEIFSAELAVEKHRSDKVSEILKLHAW
jgi:hypothetical protein